MIRLALLLVALLASSACQVTGSEAIIRSAETKLVMPKDADPLLRYDRYYAISGTVATGVFIRSEGELGKMNIVAKREDLPFVADGGCGVVEVRLDLKKGVWERPFCHGM